MIQPPKNEVTSGKIQERNSRNRVIDIIEPPDDNVAPRLVQGE